MTKKTRPTTTIKKYFDGLEIDFSSETARRVEQRQKAATIKNSGAAFAFALVSVFAPGWWSIAAGVLPGWFLIKLSFGLLYPIWYRRAKKKHERDINSEVQSDKNLSDKTEASETTRAK